MYQVTNKSKKTGYIFQYNELQIDDKKIKKMAKKMVTEYDVQKFN